MTARIAHAQRWLVRAIAAPRPPRSLRRLGGSTMDAATGLGIYRHAYRARLRECLTDDYPVLAALLGTDAFGAVASAFIDACPSRDATLNRYGGRLVPWLRAHPAATPIGRLALDVARLEWALVEAIHAPVAPAITPRALAAVPARSWGRVRLVPVPGLGLITSRWAIDACHRQHLRGEAVTIPEPDPGMTVVWRGPEGLVRQVLPPPQGRLLARLVRGQDLGTALAACPLPPAVIDQAFRTFIAAGLFTRIDLP